MVESEIESEWHWRTTRHSQFPLCKKKLANLTPSKRPRGAATVILFREGNKVRLTCRRRELCRNQLQLSRLSNVGYRYAVCVVSTVRDELYSRLRQATANPGGAASSLTPLRCEQETAARTAGGEYTTAVNPRLCPVHVNVKYQHAFNVSARQLELADTLLCSDSWGDPQPPLQCLKTPALLMWAIKISHR